MKDKHIISACNGATSLVDKRELSIVYTEHALRESGSARKLCVKSWCTFLSSPDKTGGESQKGEYFSLHYELS